MPPTLQLMLDSLWPLVRAGLVFTVPLAILSFAFGLSLGFMTAVEIGRASCRERV